jgi:predicted patatin/cPLA2 family phospholipase
MPVDLKYLQKLRKQDLEPAIQNVLDRKIKMLEGQPIDKSRKLGIIAEGGAMRAVISGGGFIGLDFLGLNNVFDIIYGSSAGAINGAYFLAYQIAYGVAVYYQLINNKNFVDLKRLIDFRRNAMVVNMDFLFDEIITKERALDVTKVKSSDTDLYFTVTNIKDGSCEFFSNREENLDLPKALKASSAIPVYYNKPVEINGEFYLDGSVANSLPIEEAIEAGCTDILVLLTRPAGYRRQPSGPISKIFEGLRLGNYSKEFIEKYFTREGKYNKSLDIIFGVQKTKKSVNISVVTPTTSLARTATNELKLKQVTMDYTRNTLYKFGCRDIDVAEVIQPVIRVNSQY